MVKNLAPYVKRCDLYSARIQTHTQTYIQRKNWGRPYFFSMAQMVACSLTMWEVLGSKPSWVCVFKAPNIPRIWGLLVNVRYGFFYSVFMEIWLAQRFRPLRLVSNLYDIGFFSFLSSFMPYLESTKFNFVWWKVIRKPLVIPFIDILLTGSIKLERIFAKQNRSRSCMLS